jgi:uncharacterized protein YaeQ
VALKPTIYKFGIALSDLDRNYYDQLNLTIARHPSETLERMLVRVLAFCYNAQERLVFCKGLSDTEEPDVWAHTLDGSIDLWIDVGEPAVDRIKKASRLASVVKVYCFNTKSGTWWEQGRSKIAQLSVSVFRLQWEQLQALAQLVERTMEISVTITEGSAYIAAETGDCELSLQVLQ